MHLGLNPLVSSYSPTGDTPRDTNVFRPFWTRQAHNILITMRWFKQSQLAIPIVVVKRQFEFITYQCLLQHPDGLIQPVLLPDGFHVQQ